MAAPVKLTTHAKEKGAYLFEVTTTDFGGTSVVADTFLYSVTDLDGSAINGLTDQTPGTIATTTSIVIYGTSLSLIEAEDTVRIFTCSGTFDSVYGSAVTFTGEAQFIVDNLLNIS